MIEGAGAVGLAGILSGKIDVKNGKGAPILTSCNTAATKYSMLMYSIQLRSSR